MPPNAPGSNLAGVHKTTVGIAENFKTCYKKPMKKPWLIVGILAVVHLIMAVVAFYCLPSHNDWLGYSLFMLFPSQASLIGIWTALGGKHTPLRVILIFIGTVICLRIVMTSSFSHDIHEVFQVSTTHLIGITILLLAFRLTGLKIESWPAEPWKSEPFQFTILQIMTWTATVAVIMSALHYFPKDTIRIYPGVLQLLGTVASLGNVALMSMWLVFGKKWLLLRVLAIPVAIGCGAWILVLGFNREWFHYGMLFFYESIWTILSLLVIRWAGYQMTWHWRLRRFTQPAG
jgi:hypothetical protein